MITIIINDSKGFEKRVFAESLSESEGDSDCSALTATLAAAGSYFYKAVGGKGRGGVATEDLRCTVKFLSAFQTRLVERQKKKNV